MFDTYRTKLPITQNTHAHLMQPTFFIFYRHGYMAIEVKCLNTCNGTISVYEEKSATESTFLFYTNAIVTLILDFKIFLIFLVYINYKRKSNQKAFLKK